MDVTATSAEVWRAWLETHGRTETEVWLVIPHKDSATPGLRYHEAIEHALCYGWIDGLHRKHDAHSSRLRFTPRRPTSSWSALNRERATRMIAQGLMTEAGQATIDYAKTHGTWQRTPEELPDDLRKPLEADSTAHANFTAFPPSSQRLILEWIASAKKPETRQRRITRTVELAAANLRANHR
ncbi:YdeI/OmpD-associated family protein [Nocardia carnea]|uniref:YdeI/OmpD-associated family protein n=1 Tax=Nocardia carnea TaxID=37328 RepID=UPI002457934B|nr:YdeI/OmpD-associated family protein [Nocardia carnea]